MRTRTDWMLVVWGALAASMAAAEAPKPPPEIDRAAKELWRRGTCLLSSVYKPAAKEAAVPADLGATPVVRPHVQARQGALRCYAADGASLWAADDQCLYRADAAGGTLQATYDRTHGLPDEAVQSIAAAGDAVWLATRGRLLRLDVRAGRIEPVPDVALEMGRLAAGPSGVWLLSDAGAWRLAPGDERWRRLGDFPGRQQLAELVRRGFWAAEWNTKLDVLLPAVAANADGLYAVCMNRLVHCAAADGAWKELAQQVWSAQVRGRTVWAIATDGVVRHDGATGRTDRFEAGKGPAAGRPVALAAADRAVYLASQPDYDAKAGRFVGGGVSRLDLATGEWAVTETVGEVDVRFVSAVAAEGDEAWAACTLYDKVAELGAHPGMAHVKRWRPHASGLGLLCWREGKWALTQREGLKTERRWVLGQKGTVSADAIGPESVDAIRCCGDRVWGVYRIVPERYYAGYFISAGCLAGLDRDAWQGRFDVRTAELGLAGEQPELMLISHSHGQEIVLAEGHPAVLGIECVANRAWVVSESGLFVHDPAQDRCQAVLAEPARLYWRATAAAAEARSVWFGGDGGTISRLDRRTGRLELVGVAPGRKVVRMSAADGRLTVRTEKTDVVLPVSLASVPRLPDADVLSFDGRDWSAGADGPAEREMPWKFPKNSNYLCRGGDRVAFLKGLFRPEALCEDPAGGCVWVGAYEGVAAVPLPAKAAE